MSKAKIVTGAGEVRIIAGRYRGRRLQFPAAPGLRPTGDRLRETLFSWLQTELPGARCLDLFAGSGALGFEAASRGASDVVMVEANASVAAALQANISKLAATEIRLVRGDALHYLQQEQQPFAVIFLDPPFHGDWLDKVLALIAARALLRPGGWIYIENERDAGAPVLPAGWHWYREKEAGQVRYALAQRDDADSDADPVVETDTNANPTLS
ncbi:16S rRNA (guanine(966)-N(2))-methyltransferase RsmD [Permianibacter sp. IMCC34836]|uniref:16S rRNA (guanine(966)-N(2))-methyltransferase RsmD n=1 Tax=Permianibacter fluminis TaxID=2738515 RepID=UPI0015549505|nr:16S rRNA (guanine(966)-N(2))-methyltransferase RsmD [Permianibacter fluminis]NQD35728.1 16S rRNA (guanine(966)-N(2))-methyltransferase RsmD [Permianibacter fluminis]